MGELTRDILVASKAEARWKPSGFQGLMLKLAGKRAALQSSGISGVEILKTLPQPGRRPLFVKILALQHHKRHQFSHINES